MCVLTRLWHDVDASYHVTALPHDVATPQQQKRKVITAAMKYSNTAGPWRHSSAAPVGLCSQNDLPVYRSGTAHAGLGLATLVDSPTSGGQGPAWWRGDASSCRDLSCNSSADRTFDYQFAHYDQNKICMQRIKPGDRLRDEKSESDRARVTEPAVLFSQIFDLSFPRRA